MSRALGEASIPLHILPGADVHLDRSVPGCLERGELITVADLGRHLLLEFPQDIVPEGTGELLFQVQLQGVTPIITHPERNIAIQQNPAILNDLVRAGSLTQITAGSLTGVFGARVRKCTLRLLASGTAHLVSTDAHSTGRRSPRLSEARRVVEEEVGREEAERMFRERPDKDPGRGPRGGPGTPVRSGQAATKTKLLEEDSFRTPSNPAVIPSRC